MSFYRVDKQVELRFDGFWLNIYQIMKVETEQNKFIDRKININGVTWGFYAVAIGIKHFVFYCFCDIYLVNNNN